MSLSNSLSKAWQSLKRSFTGDPVSEQKEIQPSGSSKRRTIEDYRAQFKSSPRGQWSQAVGTFGAVMDEIWEFMPDQTGRILKLGPFGGLRGETCFEWQEMSDFCIAFKITKERDEDENPEDEETAEPEPWMTIRYDFKLTETDGGQVVGMYQVSEDGAFLNGFWLSMEPLMNHDNWQLVHAEA